MFQSLTGYLFGASNQNQEPTVNGVERSTRFTSIDTEDEWVLVDKDRDSEGNSDTSSIESLDIGAEAELNNTGHEVSSPTNLTRTFSTSSLPCASNMEESWFITPPPCFTSSGPVHMATSPLENLLIEHPSMSVYQQQTFPYRMPFTGGSVELTVEDDEDTDSIGQEAFLDDIDDYHYHDYDFDFYEIPEPRLRTRRIVLRRAPRTAQEQLEGRQCLKNKQAQKAKVQQACANLKRSYLERNNKAREVNGRNRRLRRGERSQGATRSHANNNRKC